MDEPDNAVFMTRATAVLGAGDAHCSRLWAEQLCQHAGAYRIGSE